MNFESSEMGSAEAVSLLTEPLVRELDQRAGFGRGMLGLRQKALERLKGLRFPTASDELWRNTKPDHFAWESIQRAAPVQLSLDPADGATSGGLPAGVTFSRDGTSHTALVEEILGERAADLAGQAPAQLLLAAASSGCVIHVARGTNVRTPLRLSQTVVGSDAKHPGAAVPLTIVVVEEGASLVLIEDLELSQWAGMYAPRVEVLLRPHAFAEFVSVQRLSKESTYLARHRFHLQHDASLKAVHVALGAQCSRVDIDCKLYEPGAQADLFALYLGTGERHVDFHPTQWHLAPHCRSNLYCKGALKDSSRSVYYGYIRVAEDAQKTDAFQKNRNLLLSPDARCDAIPNLEIKANDVKCSHGASVGQVGAEELFYLMSRGLPRLAAEKLLVEGFFADLMATISSEFTRGVVEKVVVEQLHG